MYKGKGMINNSKVIVIFPGGSTNSVEDRGQIERGSGPVAP
jgi:hypothetical protein